MVEPYIKILEPSKLSDQYEIITSLPLCSVYFKTAYMDCFSVNSGDLDTAKHILSQSLFSFANLQNSSYYELWSHSFYSIIDACFPRKRKKRISFPYYFSSHSIHIHNKCQTLTRHAQKRCPLSYSDAYKVVCLENELEESIELDRAVFIESFLSNQTNMVDCYKLIIALKPNSDVQSMMYFNDKPLTNDGEIADGFNEYFLLSVSAFRFLRSSK